MRTRRSDLLEPVDAVEPRAARGSLHRFWTGDLAGPFPCPACGSSFPGLVGVSAPAGFVGWVVTVACAEPSESAVVRDHLLRDVVAHPREGPGGGGDLVVAVRPLDVPRNSPLRNGCFA